MWRTLLVGIFGILFGIFLNMYVFTGNNPAPISESMQMRHGHPPLEISTEIPTPTLTLEATPDMMGGYNIRILTENYAWTPENTNIDPVQGEGHAHLYVNMIKVARIYSEWFHLPEEELQEGINVIRATLNANDHSEWSINGEAIADEIRITH